jgi:hypothetical protein
VRDIIKLDQQGRKAPRNLETGRSLTSLFLQNFRGENFFAVLFFAVEIINFDKSTNLAKWCFRAIYSNFCQRVFNYIVTGKIRSLDTPPETHGKSC